MDPSDRYRASQARTRAQPLRKPKVRRRYVLDKREYKKASPADERRPVVVVLPPKAILSPESLLGGQLVRSIHVLHLDYSWMTLGPCRLGAESIFDNAVASFCHTCHYCIQLRNGSRNTKALEAAFSHYGKTVQLLREELGSRRRPPSDETLIAISLMAYVDLMLAGMSGSTDFRASYNHMDAVKAILLSRPRTGKHSDLTRALVPTIAVLDFYWLVTRANVGVKPSAFDSERWWDMEPFFQHTPPSELQILQQRSFQFRVRLPRLLSLVQASVHGERVDALQMLTLAETVLGLEDRESENEALHHVKVKLTRDEATGVVAPYSFDFESPHHWPIAIQYWEGLLMALCLALKIDLIHTNEFFLDWLSPAERQRLMDNQDRVAANILMSYEYAAAHGRFGKAQIAHPLLIVWGALTNREVTRRGQPVSIIKDWILKTLQVAGTTHLRPRTWDDMDNLANVFAGAMVSNDRRADSEVPREDKRHYRNI